MNLNYPSQEQPSFNIPVEKLTYEEAFHELEWIVEKLETNAQTLAESMVFYQRGQDLARYCAALLDQSELKIKQISADQILDFTEG